MSLAPEVAPARELRVLVYAAGPLRREQLHRLIGEAGYRCVDTVEAADVVLSEGDFPTPAGLPVVALGGFEGDSAGVLASDASASQIRAALAAVAAGLTVRSPARGFEALHEHTLQALFTPREMEVLSAIGEGLTNKMIARRLDISPHTVKFHVESLFRKLGVRTRTEALAKARERRLKHTLEL